MPYQNPLTPDSPPATTRPPSDAAPTRPFKSANQNQTVGETAAAFAKESEYARTLALEHGRFWEFLLIQDLLTSRLSALKKECGALEKARASLPTRRINGTEFISRVEGELNVLAAATSKMMSCINEDLPHAVGQLGVSGDAIEMLQTVDALFDACGSVLVSERDLYEVDPPEKLKALKDVLAGISESFVEVLVRFVADWNQDVEALRKGAQDFQITVVFTAPPQLEKALVEVKKISKSPREYLGVSADDGIR
jgi:hypothetical protein